MNNTEQNNIKHTEVGFVVMIKNYLITLEGLPSACIEDLLVDDKGSRAIVVSLEGARIKAMLLGASAIKPGDQFFLKKKEKILTFGDHLLGSVVNALGEPLNIGGGVFPSSTTPLELEKEALGMNERESAHSQLITGITMVDTLLPIAKGQRQLIYGPIHSGKTIFLRSMVESQGLRGVICIYAAIGKPASLFHPLISQIQTQTTSPYTVVVAAFSDQPTPLITIAPSTAMSIAEYFSLQGKDVLLILDDLSIHAKYLREVALLAGRLPGRESYPGDIFYQHARIIERAGNFTPLEKKRGSITLLTVLETEIETYSDYILTNLMASTDGHLFFSAERYAQGIYPPLAEDQSVTRVGRNSQKLIQKQIATKTLSLLAEYRREREYTQFATIINEATKKILHQGVLLYHVFNQDPQKNIPIFAQITLLALVFSPFFADREFQFLKKNNSLLTDALIHDQSFFDLRKAVEDDVSLEQFMKILETKTPLFEKICQS